MTRAVNYMVSGGKAADAKKAVKPAKPRTGEQVVQARCQECHTSGKQGAPKLGDMNDWKPRLQNGVEPLVKSAIGGHNNMPARGGMADLSDAEMKSNKHESDLHEDRPHDQEHCAIILNDLPMRNEQVNHRRHRYRTGAQPVQCAGHSQAIGDLGSHPEEDTHCD